MIAKKHQKNYYFQQKLILVPKDNFILIKMCYNIPHPYKNITDKQKAALQRNLQLFPTTFHSNLQVFSTTFCIKMQVSLRSFHLTPRAPAYPPASPTPILAPVHHTIVVSSSAHKYNPLTHNYIVCIM